MTDRPDAAARGEREGVDAAWTDWDETEEQAPVLELDDGEPVRVGPITDEKSRWFIARWLLVITVAMGAGVLIVALLAPSAVWERVDRVATMVLVPFQTLLGTAVGWYFGGKKN